jgi:hypothetical protein
MKMLIEQSTTYRLNKPQRRLVSKTQVSNPCLGIYQEKHSKELSNVRVYGLAAEASQKSLIQIMPCILLYNSAVSKGSTYFIQTID